MTATTAHEALAEAIAEVTTDEPVNVLGPDGIAHALRHLEASHWRLVHTEPGWEHIVLRADWMYATWPAGPDPEIDTLAHLIQVVEKLTPAERARSLRYLADRYGSDSVLLEPIT